VSDLVYHLNARDEIAYVNEAWLSFARANQGEALVSPRILGRLLWDFIGDVDTQHVYRLLHRRVRTKGTPVRLCFRCDAPAVRRRLELEISPRDDQGLTYRVRTLSGQVRQPVPLLDPQRLRSERFVTMCSWCKRVGEPAGSPHLDPHRSPMGSATRALASSTAR